MVKRFALGTVMAAAGLVAAAAPAGASGPAPGHVFGGDPVPPLPSLVQTRLTRVDKALERLTDEVNDLDGANVAKSSKVVRRQLAAAWRGARYYIAHPPAPADEEADTETLTIADPVTTAMAVFDEFHNVSSTMLELTDGARVPVLDSTSRTLFLALDRRDKAIADVHTLAPPADPEAEPAEGVVTFDLTMPTLPMFLDDELQHIDGLKADATDLRPGGRRILTRARSQIVATEAQVNTWWPPAIED